MKLVLKRAPNVKFSKSPAGGRKAARLPAGTRRPEPTEPPDERARLAEFIEDINGELVREGDLRTILKRCARIFVSRLGAAAAGIWTGSGEEHGLKLLANAGARLPDDAPPFRMSAERHAALAEERTPWLVGDLLKDSNFTDQDWLKCENIGAFAGFPLIVDQQPVGLMGVFTRRQPSDLTLRALACVAHALAGTVRRKQLDETRRALLDRLEEVRESERRHLSRELHDEIAQQLAVASMKLQRAEKNILELLPDAHSIIADLVIAQELLSRNQQSLRLMARILHSEILEHFGLPEALQKFISDIRILAKENLTAISLDYPPDFPRLRLPVETDIYRTVQEVVTNALKHARARLISLQLEIRGDALRVMIRDDGCGFDPQAIPNAGIGLASMRERAELIGSKLSISSHTGAGTEILLVVPLGKNKRLP